MIKLLCSVVAVCVSPCVRRGVRVCAAVITALQPATHAVTDISDTAHGLLLNKTHISRFYTFNHPDTTLVMSMD